MKKILIITEIFYPESGLINDVVLELQNKGYEIEVLTQHPSYPESFVYSGYTNDDLSIDYWNGIKIYRFKVIEGYKSSLLKKILNYRKFVTKGKQIGKQIGNDYDQILVYQTGPLTVTLPGVFIKKKYSKKLSIWTFDIWPDTVYSYGFPNIFPINIALDMLIKKIYSSADNILISSRNFKDNIENYTSNKNIYYVPNWYIQGEQVDTNLKLDSTKFNFTFTGNISKYQNLENVLLGWKKAGLTNANLNIVGNGSHYAYLEELIKKESIPNVFLHGRYPSDQISAILNQSDTLLLPLVSSYGIDKTEPFKIQSYLKSGKPIMGVIAGAGKDLILENQLGLCAKPDDIDDIAKIFIDSITYAKDNDVKIAISASNLLTGRYNKDKIVEKLLSILEN